MHFTYTSAMAALDYLEPLGCVALLVLMYQRKLFLQFRSLGYLIALRVVLLALYQTFNHYAGHGISRKLAYKLFFYTYWPGYAFQAVLGFITIYSLYHLAMAPLKGLQRLGMLMFRWAAGIAVALTVTIAFGPHVTSYSFITAATRQLQETQSILTLCMLLFVCLAIRPMGLDLRSKIFGISLGLGVVATTDLVEAAWLSHFKTVNSTLSLISGISVLLMLGIWGVYFAMPEPKRRMIILPTTSPFLRWNQISMALGDEPGFVALGEFTPDMFAPAEVEVMRRASTKMRQSMAN